MWKEKPDEMKVDMINKAKNKDNEPRKGYILLQLASQSGMRCMVQVMASKAKAAAEKRRKAELKRM